MFFLKCSIVISLLVTLSVAIPSPTEENKDTTRYGTYIGNLNIVINCYFNSDSPNCKNKTVDAPENGESERAKEDKSNDENDMPVSQYPSHYDDVLKEIVYPDGSDEISRYKEMERFPLYWNRKISWRNRLCLVCFAIVSEQDILDRKFLGEVRRRLAPLDNRAYGGIHPLIEPTKKRLGMDLDEPVPLERDHEFCSAIIHQYTNERAIGQWKNTRNEVKKGKEDQEKKLEFYSRLLVNLRDDPTYLQCESVDKGKLAQIKAEFESILGGGRTG